ncbi:unnamed protein product [Parajaminaea phylloscopi]
MSGRGSRAKGPKWLKLPTDSLYDYIPLLGRYDPHQSAEAPLFGPRQSLSPSPRFSISSASSDDLEEGNSRAASSQSPTVPPGASASSREADDPYSDALTLKGVLRSGVRNIKNFRSLSSRLSDALFYLKATLATALITFLGSLPFSIYFKAFSTLYPFLVFSLLPLPVAVRYAWQRLPNLRPGRLSSQMASLRKRPSHARPGARLSILALPTLALVLWSAVVWYCLLQEVVTRVLRMDPIEVAGDSFLHDPWKGESRNGTVYIAVNLYNSASIMPSFAASLLMLCSYLGHGNVYVSIYESNSSDDTCLHLGDLSRRLDIVGVGNTIRCGEHGPRYPKGEAGRRLRIPFLAIARNEAMRPLYAHAAVDSELESGNRDEASAIGLAGHRISKVLWINDVYFEARDALKLLDTAGGNFDQVCAIDTFSLGFYDTWVTRDIDGERLKPMWPYFLRREDEELVRQKKPVLVNSCWNGMTAFDGSWFTRDGGVQLGLTEAGAARAKLWNVTMPIRFRAVPDDECVSSECLLSSFDQHLLSYPLRPSIFVNPEIMVSYDRAIHRWWRDWSKWYPVRVWSFLWQDLIATRLFNRITDWGRKKAECAEELSRGWADKGAPLRRMANNYERDHDRT